MPPSALILLARPFIDYCKVRPCSSSYSQPFFHHLPSPSLPALPFPPRWFASKSRPEALYNVYISHVSPDPSLVKQSREQLQLGYAMSRPDHDSISSPSGGNSCATRVRLISSQVQGSANSICKLRSVFLSVRVSADAWMGCG